MIPKRRRRKIERRRLREEREKSGRTETKKVAEEERLSTGRPLISDKLIEQIADKVFVRQRPW